MIASRSCKPTTASPACRSAATWPRRCCTATAPTPKPSPGSAGASAEHGLGVITGEVGAGKTVAVRAALAALDPARHTIIYLGNPAVGGRGIYDSIVTALGGLPRFHKATLDPANHRPPRRRRTRTRPHHHPRLDEAHLLDPDQLEGSAC